MSSATTQPVFVFSIPLIPRERANDWPTVNRYLQLTLQSLNHQTDPEWIAIICGHQAPNLPEPRDTRIHVLESPDFPIEPIDRGSTDKYRKRRHIAAWLREQKVKSAIIFGLDADDWVHKDFVQQCKQQLTHDARGLLVDSGYRVDFRSGFGELITSAFHRGCGSCFIGLFERRDLPKHCNDGKCTYSRIACGHHARQGERAEKYGWQVNKLSTPLIAYTINHSESLRGMKTGGKLRKVMPHRQNVNPRKLRILLKQEFGVTPVLGSLPLSTRLRSGIDALWHHAKKRLKKPDSSNE